MIFATIATREPHDTPPVMPLPADARIGKEVIIRQHSDPKAVTFLGKVTGFKDKMAWCEPKWVQVEWVRVYIPGVGKRCVPPTFIVEWC